VEGHQTPVAEDDESKGNPGPPRLAFGAYPRAHYGADTQAQRKTDNRTIEDCQAKGDSNSGAQKAADPQWLVHKALQGAQKYNGTLQPVATSSCCSNWPQWTFYR
jgi:hypothetical protein